MPDFLVDAVATTNINLATAPPTVIDTFTLVAGTSKVALTGQTNQTENGIYDYTSTPALVRNATDGAAANMVYPKTFGVKNGSPDNKHSEWAFDNDTAPSIGTTNIVINRARWPKALDASGGIRRNANDLSIATTGILPGTYSRATFNDRGQASGGQSAEEAATFIEGLRLVWMSASSVRVEEGASYIPGAGRIVDLAADEDISLTATANTWYYFYEYESAGLGEIEYNNQAPVTVPYRGTARVKGPDATEDNTKRFLGARRSGATANTLRKTEERDGIVRYLEDTLLSPYRVLDDGRAATWSADIDCSPVVPPTSKWALLQVNVASGNNFELGTSEITGTRLMNVKAGAAHGFEMLFPLAANRSFKYQFPGGSPVAGNGLFVSVVGFLEER